MGLALASTTFGHYKVEAQIGQGGMGEVFRAFDARLNRPVAVKVLRAAADAQATAVERFLREARAASALNHPKATAMGSRYRMQHLEDFYYSWSAAAADVNHDGILYKTVRNPKAPGGAEFVPELVHNHSGVGSDALAVDLNRDGGMDIVTATKTGTFIFWGKPRAAARKTP